MEAILETGRSMGGDNKRVNITEVPNKVEWRCLYETHSMQWIYANKNLIKEKYFKIQIDYDSK